MVGGQRADGARFLRPSGGPLYRLAGARADHGGALKTLLAGYSAGDLGFLPDAARVSGRRLFSRAHGFPHQLGWRYLDVGRDGSVAHAGISAVSAALHDPNSPISVSAADVSATEYR